MSTTFLVSGAAGFIGFHLSRRLLQLGYTVVGMDSINDYYDPELKWARLEQLGFDKNTIDWGNAVQSSLYPEGSFIRADLEDRETIEKIFSSNSFDCVVNLAAQAGVRYSIENPYAYSASNLCGFLNILEACRHAGAGHLVYASSSSVYGLNSAKPFSVHGHADHPVSLYAATKRSNELMAHAYAHLYKLPVTGLRFFTVYGPWGRPDMAYFKFTRAISENKPIDVYNKGNMYRDFTYIDDIVEGIIRVCSKRPQGSNAFDPAEPDPAISSAPYRIYNIGNNNPEKLSEFIEVLEQALGKKAEKNYFPMQDGDVFATAADVSDLELDFDWKPSTDIRSGLQKFAEWYKEFYLS